MELITITKKPPKFSSKLSVMKKKFYAECYINDEVTLTLEKGTAQAAENIAEDFVLYNRELDNAP